jgi:hypothetical protein
LNYKIIQVDEPLWKNEKNRLFDLRTRLFDLADHNNDLLKELYRERAAFSKTIKKDQPDYYKHLAYHLLIGSTPDQTEHPKIDFSKTEDSVENWMLKKIWGLEKERVYSLYRKILKLIDPGMILELYQEIIAHSDKLNDKYPDCYKYIAFHIMIGSTMEYTGAPKIDFPDPADSVENFILKKIAELTKDK